MRIPIYCSDMHRLSSVLEVPLDSFILTAYTNWTAFDQARGRAPCSVLLITSLCSDEGFDSFVAASRGGPGCPTILVTARDPENLRHAASVCVAEIVWIEEVRRELPTVLDRVVRYDPLREAATALEHAPGVPQRLREALLYACWAERAPRTVTALAKTVGCDRTTLCRQWRATGAAREMRLQDCLDWLFLMRAAQTRAAGVKWHAIADGLNVQLRSLARMARRLTGCGLGNLAGDSHAWGPLVAQRLSAAPSAPSATFCPSSPQNVN